MSRPAAASICRDWVSGAVRQQAAAYRLATHSAWPVFDVLLRLWLAGPFLMGAAMRMMGMGSRSA